MYYYISLNMKRNCDYTLTFPFHVFETYSFLLNFELLKHNGVSPHRRLRNTRKPDLGNASVGIVRTSLIFGPPFTAEMLRYN